MRVPDPMVAFEEDDLEHETLIAESVGLALLVVLKALTPAAQQLASAPAAGASPRSESRRSPQAVGNAPPRRLDRSDEHELSRGQLEVD